MAEIYILDLGECSKALSALAPSVSQKRRAAAERVKNELSALEKIGSEVLLAFSLKQSLPLEYKLLKNGKPYIPTLPFFNISHSGGYVVCAVSNKEVGVDIEKVSRMKTSLSRHIMSIREYEATQTFSGARLQNLLCEKWVRKEAYLKMLGTGLRRSMTEITFMDDELVGEDVFSRVYEMNGFLISFCRSEEVPVTLIPVTQNDLVSYFNIKIE